MNVWKTILHLLIIYSVLFTAFFLTSEILSVGMPFSDVLILLTANLIISFFSVYIFLHGRKRDETKSLVLTLAALGLKIGLNMVLILIFYVLSKIDGTKFIITFFIIYLTFTGYLISFFIRTLKISKIKH